MKILKNILRVMIGNLTTVVSGIFVGFILPKIISVSDYGFYKIFTLYFNYIGVLSIGIIDGIVLKYGRYNYDELDRKKFRVYFAWYSIVNLFFTAILLVVSILLSDIDYSFIFLILCANILPVNYTGYFQQISQITQRFKEFSIVKTIQSVANVFLIGVLFVIYNFSEINISYRLYLVGTLILNLLLNFWYMVTYRDIIFGERQSLRSSIKEIISLIKMGFPLLLANLCTTFMLSLDRQFVSVLFSTEEYAIYAFAYSMLALITVATSSISIVIYPIFKRIDKEILMKNYGNISAIVLIFSFFIILVYYPLCYFINWFLPLYEYSLLIFKIILPGLVISTVISVIMHNYYKVIDLSNVFLKKSVLVLIISIVFNFVAYYIFYTREAISIASVLALLIWYIISEFSLRKYCALKYKNFAFIVVMSICFYLCTLISKYWLGALINLISLVIMIVFFYAKDLKNIAKLIKK